MNNIAYNFDDNTDNYLFKVGIYTRISVEEKIKSLADSIANQKAMLKDYTNKMGFTLKRIYEDEGKRGGNYDRPAFKEMLQDIENGIINCVIVKDLSRLGREYIETGQFLEKYFPEHNVRFISTLENLDSFANPERMQDIDIPIINIFNEDYLKRTSKSTKSILNVKRRDGEFVGAIVPYGYVRSTAKKNQLIIDEEVSATVKRIFNLYLEYNGMKQIAAILNNESVVTPSVRRKQLKGEVCTKSYKWTDNTIRSILMQEIYTGDMVQGKTKSYSHKVKKRIPLPREQWTIVPNTHEAIIDKLTFETVQDMIKLKSKPMTKKHKTSPSVLNGLLVCKECGKKMQRTIVNKDSVQYYYYTCSTYKNMGKKICHSHAIHENAVIDTILTTLNTMIDNMVDVEVAMNRNNQQLVEKAMKKIQNSLDINNNDLTKYKKAKSCLYVDYTNGDMAKVDYEFMKKDFDKKCKELDNRKLNLEHELDSYKHKNLFENKAFNTFTKYKGISTLDRRTVVSLIDKIIVDKDTNLKIMFKFKDETKKYQYLVK